jgi:hypothetical protein
LAGKGAPPHFNQNPVYHGGSPANRCRTVACTFTGLADKRHLAKILIP